MSGRFILIATLAFSFIFPVAMSGLGLPGGEAMAKTRRYQVTVQGEWSNEHTSPLAGQPSVVTGDYESSAHSSDDATASGISQFKKDYPDYIKNVKAISTEEIREPETPLPEAPVDIDQSS